MNLLKLPKMRRLLIPVEKQFMVHGTWYELEETFSTWTIILSYKCFSSTFERSPVSWSTQHASARRAELRDSCTAWARAETSKARVPRYEPQKRAYLDTNELLRGRTNTRWASNRKMKNELRRARRSSSTNYYAGGTNTRLHRPYSNLSDKDSVLKIP